MLHTYTQSCINTVMYTVEFEVWKTAYCNTAYMGMTLFTSAPPIQTLVSTCTAQFNQSTAGLHDTIVFYSIIWRSDWCMSLWTQECHGDARWAWWATHVSCCWNNMAVWTIASWSLWSLTSASWTVTWQVSPQRYTVFPGMCTRPERFLFIRTERFPFPVVWIPKG